MVAASQSKLDPEFEKNLRDPYWRLNNLYWIIDEQSNRVKFKMRYAQQKFWDEMWFWNELLKSRQHGFSTLIDLIGLDLCLFNDNIEAGIIAHTKEAVQHIFATKILYPYNNLPQAIKNRIPALKSNANELKWANNSWMRVAMSMRSSTLRFLHVSERGKICAKYPQKAEELKTGTMPALHEGSYFYDESTAEGGAGDFYEACIQSQADTAKSIREDIPLNKMQSRFHFFAWHDDPKNATDPRGITISDELRRYFAGLAADHGIELSENQRAWYALKRDGAQGLGRLIKREHPSYPAEAFEQAVEGAVFGIEMEKVRSTGRITFLPYQENEPVYTFWDLGIGHPTSVLFAQFIDQQVNIIDYHEEANRGIVYHCKVVKDKEYCYGTHYFPHDARKRDSVTATPLIDTIRELLNEKDVVLVDRCNAKGDSIQAGRMVFPHVFFEAKKTARLQKCLSFYRYKWDDNAGRFNDLPEDDWSADGADAFQCMATAWVELMIGGKRLGRTVSAIGNIPIKQSSYDNNMLTRGLGKRRTE
ncbi:hypothetical protein LCGC14_0967480 [marine sediment metagenome]|uniref:Terminase large subunit gp17-like C-terminal domain-containing protein n=1 Tax=marine sediment metagenome TaxID=412755 RepID=A0A0F9NH58_9ZZZZ